MRKREGYPAAILHALITGNRPGYTRHIHSATAATSQTTGRLTNFLSLSLSQTKLCQILIGSQGHDNSLGGVVSHVAPVWIDHKVACVPLS